MTIIERGARDRMVAPASRAELLRALGLDSVEGVLSLEGGEIFAESRTTRTLRVPGESGGKALFVKIYLFPAMRDVFKGLFRGTFLGRPRARREFDALSSMRSAGLEVVEPVAFGRRCEGPFLRAAFIITLESEVGGVSLDRCRMLFEEPPGSRARRPLVAGLAELARRMHEANFSHGDFFLRNIILFGPPEAPRFAMLDCPKAKLSRRTGVLSGAALDDLASLDAGASAVASRTERLRFLLKYASQERVTPRLRAAIAGIRKRRERLSARERQRLEAVTAALRRES